jgi:hypothetical protein
LIRVGLRHWVSLRWRAGTRHDPCYPNDLAGPSIRTTDCSSQVGSSNFPRYLYQSRFDGWHETKALEFNRPISIPPPSTHRGPLGFHPDQLSFLIADAVRRGRLRRDTRLPQGREVVRRRQKHSSPANQPMADQPD